MSAGRQELHGRLVAQVLATKLVLALQLAQLDPERRADLCHETELLLEAAFPQLTGPEQRSALAHLESILAEAQKGARAIDDARHRHNARGDDDGT